jgi:hypothetical protein
MKTLPEHFAIKRDETHPLWRKYIQWLHTKGFMDEFGIDWRYYGLFSNNGKPVGNASDVLNYGYEISIITLEQWEEAVNGKSAASETNIKSNEYKKGYTDALNAVDRVKEFHYEPKVNELLDSLEKMCQWHEKQATWDKGDNGYYKAKQLLKSYGR